MTTNDRSSEKLSEPIPNGKDSTKPIGTEGYVLNQEFRDFWFNAGFGTTCALAIWPYGIYLSGLLDQPVSQYFARSLIEVLIMLAFQLVLGLAISCLVAAIVVGVAIAMVVLFCVTLNRPHESPLAAQVASGLSALLVTLPITMPSTANYSDCEWLIIATILAYVGAAHGIKKAALISKRQIKHTAVPRPRRQFTVKELIVVTTWCAGFFATLKFTDQFRFQFAVVLSTWTLTLVLLITCLSENIKNQSSKSQKSRST